MNIRDIAKLANVSVSTVSKIINNKSDSISADTRDRVLRIVKEYNYTPYDGIRSANNAHSFLIGVLISQVNDHVDFLKSVLDMAGKHGYSTIVCISHSVDEELKNMIMLLNHRVDGLVWDQVPNSLPQCLEEIKRSNIPVQYISSNKETSSIYFNYHKLGYEAMNALLVRKHQQVMCLVNDRGLQSHQFMLGCQQCFFDYQLPPSGFIVLRISEAEADEQLIPFAVTGVVCESEEIARRIEKESRQSNRSIPRQLSLVTLGNKGGVDGISKYRLPYGELGRHVCKCLIDKVEGRGTGDEVFQMVSTLDDCGSIDIPITFRNKKILVFGTLNIDTLISTSKFPQIGETTRAQSRMTMPGGKGINQAIGAARLGAEVCLLGKVGKDYDGNILYHYLQSNGVNTEGVFSTAKADTGHAYIQIQNDGESGIVIYDGANNHLTCEEIDTRKHLFENVSYCLLQTEMNQELVLYVARLAKEHGSRIILKPSAVGELSKDLLACVDILLPNEKELHMICPGEKSIEEKAQQLLNQGVDTVIVTLGVRGGYFKTWQQSMYFPAAKCTPVDTTGAADAFCSTLAVYLSLNYDLENSICFANIAAGYSTTRYGAAPSYVPDKNTLDFLVRKEKI